jgi:hypothetical protein
MTVKLEARTPRSKLLIQSVTPAIALLFGGVELDTGVADQEP